MVNRLRKNGLRDGRQIFFGGVWHIVVLLLLSVVAATACRTSATSFDTADKDSPQARQDRAAIDTALAGIEKYRKGDAVIRVIDKNGKPLPNARLDIRQLSHSFKFGCYLKIDDLEPGLVPNYERRFAALFNYAVVGTYWDAMETRRGDENWIWFDREIQLAQKMGIGIQASPVLWGTNKYGTPAWLPRDKDDLQPVIERRVKSVLSRNEHISDWEIVNEPLAPKRDAFAGGGTENYISSAFRWAKEADPNGRHLINEYGVFGSVADHNYNRDTYFELLSRSIAMDVPIDLIGMQAHANGEWYSPSNVAENLERYASLGRPIQITEFSAQTKDFNDRRSPLAISGEYRSGVWDDAKQAEFYREFYTVAFGNPHVDAIITWGLDDYRAWLPGIGLIDKHGIPKPVYRELDALINSEWKTRLSSVADNGGSLAMRGFYGKYEVTATRSDGAAVVRTEFDLDHRERNVWTIQIGK